jgi:hypothetical protein
LRCASAVRCDLERAFEQRPDCTLLAQQQAVSRREPQFENDQMKVWKSIIMPNQPFTLHRHDHGRALIALTDGVLNLVDKDNKPLDQ